MIYGDVKLQQVSPTEWLAVSRRDKRRQIGCFPDRQGDNPAPVCVNKNAAISPLPDDGVNTSVHQPGSHHRSQGPSPPTPSPPHCLPACLPACLSRFGTREVTPSAAGVRQHGWQREEMRWHMVAQAARVLLVPLTAPVAPKKNQTRSTILFVCAVNTAVLRARNPFKQD